MNYILLSVCFITSCLTFSLTYANATLTCAQMDAAMKTAMESVTHDPEMYVRHHEGLVRWMECVLRAAGINQAYVKLSAQEAHVPPYYLNSTVILVVMPDPAVPEFPGVMVSITSFNLAAAIQSVARKMTKRIVARFWNTKFKESIFRLIPRAISVKEDRWAAIAAIATAPNQERGRDPHLLHCTVSYLFDVDNLRIAGPLRTPAE